jgi:hypothetical protein
MSWGMVAVAGASLGGAVLGADAAGDAAQTQAGATREANALQEKQYQQTRTDLAPWRQTGSAANSKLAQLLGLSSGSASAESRDAIRSRLLPQFTTAAAQAPASDGGYQGENAPLAGAGNWWSGGVLGRAAAQPGGASTVDEAGLSAAIERELASQATVATDPNAADYGSLLKRFTGDDLASEPGYQFGLQQGQKGIDRRALSGGRYFSGAALKEAARYGNDYAGTKYGEAFNRDASQKRQAYDFLSGQSSGGQNAATMTANAGSQMAGQVGANTTALGNAQGAAQIAQGNAYGNALTNAAGTYNQGLLMDRILGGNSGFGASDSWRTTGNGMPR